MEAKESYEATVMIDPIVRKVQDGDAHAAVEVTFPDKSATFDFVELTKFISALEDVMEKAEKVYEEGEYGFGKED